MRVSSIRCSRSWLEPPDSAAYTAGRVVTVCLKAMLSWIDLSMSGLLGTRRSSVCSTTGVAVALAAWTIRLLIRDTCSRSPEVLRLAAVSQVNLESRKPYDLRLDVGLGRACYVTVPVLLLERAGYRGTVKTKHRECLRIICVACAIAREAHCDASHNGVLMILAAVFR